MTSDSHDNQAAAEADIDQPPDPRPGTASDRETAHYRWLPIAAVYALLAVFLLFLAGRQSRELNLSPAAGGQMPYLSEAEGMAQDCPRYYVSDRNRMPLVPAITALGYDAHWPTFVANSKRSAIATSLVALAIIALVAHQCLRRRWAVLLVVAAACTLYADKLSFVHAEPLFFALFFASWWLLLRLLRGGGWVRAVAAGLVIAITYYCKASVLLLLLMYVLCAGLQGLMFARRKRPTSAASVLKPIIVCVVFLVVTGPYLWWNYLHLGEPFFNINSRIVMWSDSWTQAQQTLDHLYLQDASARQVIAEAPGPLAYWHSHSLWQIFGRLWYGVRSLAAMASGSLYGWLLVLTAALIVGQHWWRRRPGQQDDARRCRAALRTHEAGASTWLPIAFCLATAVGYLLIYAWYVQVAYGDRFLQSLIIPALAGGFWLLDGGHPRSRTQGDVNIETPSRSSPALIAIAALVVCAGPVYAHHKALTPTKEFIIFFANEARAMLEHGQPGRAAVAFEGVLRLDPTCHAGALGLGMSQLQLHHPQQAIDSLQRAALLAPRHADTLNTLGGAYAGQHQYDLAIRAFERAIDMEPHNVLIRRNFIVTLLQAGQVEAAQQALDRLAGFAPSEAARIEAASDVLRSAGRGG